MIQREKRFAAMILLPVVLLAAAAAQSLGSGRILFDQKSAFNRVIVEEDESGVRSMLFEENGATQSAIDTKQPHRLMLSYTRAIMLGFGIVPQPKRILIVGLGGGSMPMFMRREFPEAHIDVAELDPVVAVAARKFFFLQESPTLQVHIGDGRKFIEETQNRYDVIFLDAYGSDSIPYALATREFLQAVREKLSPGGICVGNVWSQSSNDLYFSMVRTYRDVFPELHIVRATASENRIFIALKEKLGLGQRQLVQRATEFQRKHRLEFELAAIAEWGYLPESRLPADAKVLVDRDAPKE